MKAKRSAKKRIPEGAMASILEGVRRVREEATRPRVPEGDTRDTAEEGIRR